MKKTSFHELGMLWGLPDVAVFLIYWFITGTYCPDFGSHTEIPSQRGSEFHASIRDKKQPWEDSKFTSW